jgi:glycosyltransferase involved in cell wall biosynthesis
MATLSVIVLTLNEEHNIEACLQSVHWADEIIVVDSGSTDNTRAIAGRFTDNVIEQPWLGFAEQRNFAETLVRGDWVLTLDADERVSTELAASIREVLAGDSNGAVAYRVQIRDWMFGKFVKYGSWPHQHHVRLYRRGQMIWGGVVHEQQGISGEIGHLSGSIWHYSHTSVRRFIEKLNTYTELEAEQMFQQGQRASLPAAVLGALRAFLGQYVRLQGFRDGGHGLILAVLMALYFFTTRAKLWSLWYIQEHAE